MGNGQFIELFSFPEFAQRPNYPEAVGLRHLAFKVKDISKTVKELDSKGIKTEDVRTDPETGIKFTFFKDPDELPIEIREIIISSTTQISANWICTKWKNIFIYQYKLNMATPTGITLRY